MMKFLPVFVLSAVFALSFGQDSKDAACRSLVKCLSDVDEARTQCDNQRKATNISAQKNQSTSADECSTIDSKNDAMRDLQSQQKQQQRECLTNSFAEATPVGDKNKQNQCQKVVSDYQQPPTVNAAIGADANVNNNVKTKRQVGGISANSNISTDVSTSSNNSRPVGSGGHRGNGTKGGGKGNGTSGNAAANQIKQCYQNADTKQKLCRELYSCCSEVTPCDMKYHLSPLHAQVYQAQLDLFYLRRRCQQQNRKGGPAPNSNATATANPNGATGPNSNTNANVTVSTSMKGGNAGNKP